MACAVIALPSLWAAQLTNNGTAHLEVCAGYFCDQYLDTMFILMTHNSFCVPGDFVFPNQQYWEPQQLEDGIRGFSMDVFEKDNGHVYMTHENDPFGTDIDYATRVQQILAKLDTMQDGQYEFILIQFEDYLKTSLGVANACEAWGDKLITDFDIDKPLGDYLKQGQQVLIMTNEEKNVNTTLGMHHASELLAENRYEWNDPLTSPDMTHRRGPNGNTDKHYAKMLNYFCTSPPFFVGSASNSEIVNTKTRMQCHAQEFKQQNYAQDTINIMMIDFYHLTTSNGAVLVDAQTAIRAGDFGDADGADCIVDDGAQCNDSGSSCNFFSPCDACCQGSSCRWLFFGCTCN
eukprot:scaffold75773_cov57-Attheya_sp.AAC.8